METNKVYEGDCIDVMRQFPDNCIDTVITDPPYGLSFMGKNWDHGLPGKIYWYEVLRIAKPGTILLAFGGTRTYHRLTCAIEDAGWEIRDCIMWIYGSGFPKSHNISKAIDKAAGAEREVVGVKPGERYKYAFNSDFNFESETSRLGSGDAAILTIPSTPLARGFSGYGSALKPAYEPIVVAMKSLDGTYANNAEKWGLAGLWIDGGRVKTGSNGRPLRGSHNNRPKETATSYDLGSGFAIGTTTTGRWPADLVWDGSDEVLAEFDKVGVRKSGAIDKNKSVFKQSSTFLSQERNIDYQFSANQGSTSRFFQQCPPDSEPVRFRYCSKVSKKERGQGNNHPTVKPLSLLKYLCRLTRTPYGGIVLDPFAGSGTTALAAIAEKCDFILIEKESEYAEICKQRIAEYTGVEIVPKEVKVKDETVKQMGLW